ncbi:MAG: glycosyltransferase family 2 protein [Kiritimatiellae bacterium]|nr:glycosyltransferase family 2 protein [Kiritimatiellia bacterium]
MTNKDTSYTSILLSIVMPIYNAEITLKKTLASLNNIKRDNQNMVEVIIVDDGSSDNSMTIAQEWNPVALRVCLLHHEHGGASTARNRAIEESKGRWVMFLDADDELSFDPTESLNRHSKASAIGFATVLHKNGKQIWKYSPVRIAPNRHMDTLTATNPFPISGLIIRREAITKLFDPEFFWAEDWLFWMENQEVFANMIVCRKETSATIHVHTANKSCAEPEHGKYRTMAAGKILRNSGKTLSTKQTNNLLLQSAIGSIQQGLSMPIRTWFRFPCNPCLYMKLVLYATGIAKRIQPFKQS